jgi:hypothetical protein
VRQFKVASVLCMQVFLKCLIFLLKYAEMCVQDENRAERVSTLNRIKSSVVCDCFYIGSILTFALKMRPCVWNMALSFVINLKQEDESRRLDWDISW